MRHTRGVETASLSVEHSGSKRVVQLPAVVRLNLEVSHYGVRILSTERQWPGVVAIVITPERLRVNSILTAVLLRNGTAREARADNNGANDYGKHAAHVFTILCIEEQFVLGLDVFVVNRLFHSVDCRESTQAVKAYLA